MAHLHTNHIQSTDDAWPPDAALLTWLMAGHARPNILVECRRPAIGPVLGYLRQACDAPLSSCALPGVLDLPTTRHGTLLVENVAALTLLQQRQFFEWMSAGCDGLQVISVTSEPLTPLVEQGDFMESLFYRLNVVRVALELNQGSDLHDERAVPQVGHASAQ